MIRGKRFWKFDGSANGGEEGTFMFIDPLKIIGIYREDNAPKIDTEGGMTFILSEDDYTALKAWAEGESTVIGRDLS